MSFSESGGVITQTGTDADLSGLSAIAGVSTNTNRDVTIYDIGTLRLDVQGTLSHDPDTEVLICTYIGANPSITLSGTYNYGIETTANGNTRRSGGMGLIIQGGDTASQAEHQMNNYGGIYVNGGTLNMYGGVYLGDRGIGFYNSPTLAIINTKFIKVGTTSRREIRFDDEAVPAGSFSGIIDGFQISARELPATFAPTILNGELAQLAAKTAGTAITTLSLEGLDTSGSISTDADLLTDDHISSSGGGGDAYKFWDVINSSEGSNTRIMPKSGVGDDRMRGGGIMRQRIKFIVKDDQGAFAENVKVYSRDTDNGFRKNANGQDHTADKTYTAITNASGDSGDIVVVVAVTNIDTDGAGWAYTDWDTTALLNRFKVDRRAIDDSGSDLFDWVLFGYLYDFGLPQIEMKGINDIEVAWTVFPDALLTETDKALVDAYPITIGLVGSVLTITGDAATVQTITSAQLYDAVRGYLWDNHAGETQTIVTRTGDQIDARDLTVNLDYINLVGGITTTDVVNLTNGSGVTGGIIDSNGDSFLSFTHEWEVYANEADRNASTNLLASGTASENFRFNFSGGTTYYMWVAGTKQEITPAASGETEVNLSTAALLVGIQASLGNIPGVVYLDTTLASNGNGSQENPFNNMTDTIDFAVANRISDIHFQATAGVPVLLPKSAAGLKFFAQKDSLIIDFNGQDIDQCYFYRTLLTGACVTAIGASFDNCYLFGVTGFRGIIQDCLIAGDVELIEGTTIVNTANNSQTIDTPPTITVTGNIKVGMRGVEGEFNIAGITGTASVSLVAAGADITIDASCTGGSIVIYGLANITDNSAGTTVTDLTITSSGGASNDWTEAEKRQMRDALGIDGTKVAAVGGDIQSIIASLASIPTNPLLTNDARLDNLDTTVSSRSTNTNITDAEGRIINAMTQPDVFP